MSATTDRSDVLTDVRAAFVELLGAERRVRGRDQQRQPELSYAQVRALVLLADRHAATAGELAKAADLTPASVTGMLDHLEAAGTVQRRRSDEDRRRVVVTLTDAGRTMIEAKRARWSALWQEALADMPDAEIAAATRVLHRMAAALDGL